MFKLKYLYISFFICFLVYFSSFSWAADDFNDTLTITEENNQIKNSLPLKDDFVNKYGTFFPELMNDYCRPVNFQGVLDLLICQNGELKNIVFDKQYDLSLTKTMKLLRGVLNNYRKKYEISIDEAALLKAIALQNKYSGYSQKALNDFIIYMVDHIDPQARNVRYAPDDLDEFYKKQDALFMHLGVREKDGANFMEAMHKLAGEANVRLMLGMDSLVKDDKNLTQWEESKNPLNPNDPTKNFGSK